MRFPLVMVVFLLAMTSGDCGFIEPSMLQCTADDAWMQPQFCDPDGWNESNPLNEVR